MEMGDLQLHVTFGGRSCVVPLGRDEHQLRGNLAAEFDLLAVDVKGFARGGSLYPVSYVAQASRQFLLSTRERALELVALNAHGQANFFGKTANRQNDVIISFPLTSTGKLITVTRRQLELLNFVRTKTGLAKISLETLRTAFDRYGHFDRHGHYDELSKEAFDMLTGDLIPSDSLNEMEAEALNMALSRVFFAFDRNGDGVAEGPDLFTALGTLVSGKGLSFAFQLADANGDGYVSPGEFMVFTRAFLTLVLALNEGVAHLSADYVSSLIDAATDEVVRLAFHQADSNRDGYLTWSEFSSWFKSGGHMLMPWVTLLQCRRGDDASSKLQSQGLPDDEIVYEFNLAPTHGHLVITRTDVDNLEALLTATSLHTRDAVQVIELFASKADKEGMISKESYDACIRALTPALASIHREEKQRIEYTLSSIFFAFDRSGARKVRLDELCTGFLMLCAGSKSTKLQHAFALFDRSGEGSTSTIDFARFLRSPLLVLFALNDAAASLTSFQVYEAVDRTTARAVRLLVKNVAEANGNKTPNQIHFEDFAEFYNSQSGNELISYIELLDLSKYPFSDLDVKRGIAPLVLGTQAFHAESKTSEPIFSFDLYPAPSKLEVKPEDAERLAVMLNVSGIRSISPEALHSAVQRASTSYGTITMSAYEELLDRIQRDYAEEKITDVDEHTARYMFDSLFYAYDREGSREEVNSSELACGLSILCAGKKSDKLAYGFAAFDTDGDGAHRVESLARFLRSFIIALFVLVQDLDESQDPHALWKIVDATSIKMAVDVARSADNPSSIMFEDFARWYGTGGYKVASFLELLDMSKWPIDEENDEYDEADPESIDHQDSASPVYVFKMTRTHTLELTRSDIAFVREVVMSGNLHHVDSEDVIRALKAGVDELGVISEEDFMKAVKQWVPGAENPSISLEAVATLYEMCDREGIGCDYRDLLGVLLLCNGSKSTKLAQSWNLVDQDGDGELTRSELYTLVRAFITTLHVFNYAANAAPMEDLHHAIDDSANVLAANVFLDARRKKKDTISFEEFAEFYSEGRGYRLAPWLELLNLSKFIGPDVDNQGKSASEDMTNGENHQYEQLPGNLGNDKGDSRVVFAFTLTDERDQLIVTQRDVKLLRATIDNSKIGSIEAEQLIVLLSEQTSARTGQITEQGFGTFVANHVLLNKDGTKDGFVASMLFQCFAAFDRESEGSVDPIPFAVGLSLLAAGSKSSKLSLGWALFAKQSEEDTDASVGPMDRSLLNEFFVTLLTAISAFAGNCLDDDVICVAASQATERVFDDIPKPEITFDDFASWYTSRGFEYLSWIELLANAKWKLPVENGTTTTTMPQVPQQQQQRERSNSHL